MEKELQNDSFIFNIRTTVSSFFENENKAFYFVVGKHADVRFSHTRVSIMIVSGTDNGRRDIENVIECLNVFDKRKSLD